MRVTVDKIASDGTIKWIGNHHKKSILRVLVELDKPLGRNNGTVQGHLYAKCKPKHGVLVPPESVKMIGGSLAVRGSGAGKAPTGMAGTLASLGTDPTGDPAAGASNPNPEKDGGGCCNIL